MLINGEEKGGFVWLASYPKSGNTYLRHLIEAYRCNGALDIHYVKSSVGDAGALLVNGVSPMSVEEIGFRGEALIRPCALLNFYARLSDVRPLVKTHWANLTLPGLPPFIPLEFTYKAIYVVRDPRDVFVSMCNYWQYPPSRTADAMSSKEFIIGGSGLYSHCFVSSWSNHAASWIGEKKFPVHIVSYEDMCLDPVKELREVLEYLEVEDIDEDRIAKAAEAADIERVKKQEKEKGGFSENVGKADSFFAHGGGTRWREEIGPKWIERIERDHFDIMGKLGYLDRTSNIVPLKDEKEAGE